ncbi:gamma-glutamyl peptidase 5-like, partial [Ananas comosus]|uniref:Gamma-glutamyl peptidase 5-like n=1 Tax=Ananas comosus TaxID=4615 RepID=A0A6P5FI27_ANACO
EEPEHVRRAHGGYFGVFAKLLGDHNNGAEDDGEEEEEEGEVWVAYRAARGELPQEEEEEGYDGFVVTGSCSDAHGDDPWITDLVRFLQKLIACRKKVLGICFGHQILCRALGGKTGRAANGWDLGVTCIHPSHSTIKRLSVLHIPPHLPVIECHRDEVWEVPPQAEVMASSEKTGVEMFRYGDHILGIQGHPEYTKDILLHLLDRLLQCKLIQSSHAEAAKASLEAQKPDREAWKRLCKEFLKGKLFSTQYIVEEAQIRSRLG